MVYNAKNGGRNVSKSMVEKYVWDLWGDISKDAVEYRAYNLGVAVGMHQLYTYIKQCEGQVLADKLIAKIANASDAYAILKKMIELENKEPETKAEKIADKLYECKSKNTTSSKKQIKQDVLRDLEHRILRKIEGEEQVNGYWLIGFLSYAIKEILNED